MRSSNQKPFYYNIAGDDYTIDDIKHGMLRGNYAKPGHIMRVLSQSDAKTRVLPRVSDNYQSLVCFTVCMILIMMTFLVAAN